MSTNDNSNPSDLPSGGAAFQQLSKHVQGCEGRYNQLKELFKDADLSPLNSTDFQKFLEDHYSLLAMRYVVTNTFVPGDGSSEPVPGMDATELAKLLGFGVSEAKLDDAKEDIPVPTGMEPGFAAHPAVQLALEAGADLMGDDED